jgi:hypothetical protein
VSGSQFRGAVGAHPLYEDEPLWQVAKRIAASKGFAKSKFLCNFILYICEMHLAGRETELTEQVIGERVFERPAGYRPGDDNIVRNYARLLRQRLDEYFDGEGREEPIRVVVPRGGYSPLCVEVGRRVGDPKGGMTPEPEAKAPSSEGVLSASLLAKPRAPFDLDARAEQGTKTSSRLVPALWTAFMTCGSLCLVLSVLLLRAHSHRSGTHTPNPFWHAFFTPNRETMIIPADSGLAIYQDLTKQKIHLAEYAEGEYQKDTVPPSGLAAATVNDLGERRYTSFVDLKFVATVAQLPELQKERFKIRFTREASLDELKQSTVILLGSFESNPWVELFQKDLNFQFEHMGASNDIVIHNRHPAAGEEQFYTTDASDPAHSTFGLIAVTPSLDGAGRVLLVEGINMAGTEAAADYLFSDEMNSLLGKLIDKRGNIVPFEILLKTSNIGANSASPKAIALRTNKGRS